MLQSTHDARILRTQACLDNLMAVKSWDQDQLSDEIDRFLTKYFPDHELPSRDVTSKYFSGTRAMLMDSVRDSRKTRHKRAKTGGTDEKAPNREGSPNFLVTLELAFSGSTNTYFHPLFNLIWGPLHGQTATENSASIYPKAWITNLEAGLQQVEYSAQYLALSKEKALKRQAYLTSIGSAGCLIDAVERQTAIDRRIRQKPVTPAAYQAHERRAEIEMINAENARIARRRHEEWFPKDPLGWVHTNMLHLAAPYRDILMQQKFLHGEWHRRYGNVHEELNSLGQPTNLDVLAAVWAIMKEGALIGDGDRFLAGAKRLKEFIPALSQIPALRSCSGELAERTIILLGDAHARTYANTAQLSQGRPVVWNTHIYPFWLAKYRSAKAAANDDVTSPD